MRKIVCQMMSTLNGRVDSPDAWLSGIGDDLYAEIDRIYATFDTVLVGQTTYEEMFAYWPTAETDPEGSETSRSMGRKMNTYKKLVFTRGSEKKPLSWHNAEQVIAGSDEDIKRFITDLKTQPGGDIHLAGGAQLAQTVIRLGLVDEYHFFVYPVISRGANWFDQVEDKREMELVKVTQYQGGVVGLFYRPCP